MSKWHFLLLGTIFVIFQVVNLLTQAFANPFVIPELRSCEDNERTLLSTLSLWQYSGYIHGNNNIAIIHSAESNVWIQLLDLTPPARLSPWKILSISAQSIEWQSDLPVYCKKKITMTMNFQRK